MGKQYTRIDARLKSWIDRQRMFFVATAPLAGDGLINCSPKGLDSFLVLGPRRVAYVDVGGSGIETVAHSMARQRYFASTARAGSSSRTRTNSRRCSPDSLHCRRHAISSSSTSNESRTPAATECRYTSTSSSAIR